MKKITVSNSQKESELLTLPQAAKRLKCCRRFLEDEVRRRKLSIVRLSPRCVRIRLADLEEYIEQSRLHAFTQKGGKRL